MGERMKWEGELTRAHPLSLISRLPTNVSRVRPYGQGNPTFTILTRTNPLSEIFKTARARNSQKWSRQEKLALERP